MIKQNKDRIVLIFNSVMSYVSLFLVIWILFSLYYVTDANPAGLQNSHVFFMIVLTVLLVGFWMTVYHSKNIINFILAGGMFMRISYMLQTSYVMRAHDLGNISFEDNGHAAYIYTIFKTGSLPLTNEGQFYHPPLFHWLAAQVLKVFQVYHPEDEIGRLFEATKIVSCFASCAALLVMKKICDEAKLPDRAKIFIVAVMAFYPNHFLLAGRVNNDSLVFLFIMLIILFTIRWYYNQTFFNVTGLGLSFGLGMMTKINAGVMALLAAPLLILILYKKWKEKGWKTCMLQYMLLGCISFPLGLWYPIRNMMRFGQPFMYVLDPGEDSFVYRGNYSQMERFLPDLKRIFEPLYIQIPEEYNIIPYLIKSSLFGEFTFGNAESAAHALIWLNVILIILSLAAMVYILISKKEKNYFLKWGMFAVWALYIISYISFNVSYPYSCTMDFRYIVPTCFTGAFFLGIAFDALWQKKSLVPRILAAGAGALAGSFCIVSIYMYCVV